MAKKNTSKSIAKLQGEEQFKKLVEESLKEMDQLTTIAVNAGLNPEKAKEKIASIYVRNLQQTDDLMALAKKNIAELMTRIELEKMVNPDTELLGDKYVKLFKLQNEALQLLHKLEGKVVTHKVQVDDDKMVFDVTEGVYKEQ